ncbi:MAG: hypothetical protein FWE37_02510 [Spirochaetaceae bacterium]|nr:hypothetical protein [Spirochaetaceae bacterium]
MSNIVSREELQGYLATMPESKLNLIRPLLVKLLKPKKLKLNIKPANQHERATSKKIMAEYIDNPEGLVTWEDYKNGVRTYNESEE